MSKETITRCEKQKPRFHAFLKVSVLLKVVRTWQLSPSKLFSAVDEELEILKALNVECFLERQK